VIKSLGTQDFPRIRLGINPGHPVKNGADFVLSPIRKAQLEELDELLDFASQAVESTIAEGVEKAMTRFNRRARGVKQEES
jgi:PTH1 family peptidyl-tRNA hydrolase